LATRPTSRRVSIADLPRRFNAKTQRSGELITKYVYC